MARPILWSIHLPWPPPLHPYKNASDRRQGNFPHSAYYPTQLNSTSNYGRRRLTPQCLHLSSQYYITDYNMLISWNDPSPIPVRSAVKLYLTTWCIQNLSRRALNRHTVSTSTTVLIVTFRTFHSAFYFPHSACRNSALYQQLENHAVYQFSHDSITKITKLVNFWRWRLLDHSACAYCNLFFFFTTHWNLSPKMASPNVWKPAHGWCACIRLCVYYIIQFLASWLPKANYWTQQAFKQRQQLKTCTTHLLLDLDEPPYWFTNKEYVIPRQQGVPTF